MMTVASRRLLTLCAVGVWLAWIVPPAAAQGAEPQLEAVQGNVYLLTGAGANITVSAGDDGLILVDSGAVEMADKVVAAISRMPRFLDVAGVPRPGGTPISTLRYIINTSALPEHTGGNASLAVAAGAPQIYAHENVLATLTQAKVPTRGEPTLTFFGARLPLSRWVNGEPVEIVHMPAAITDGDSVVRFYRSGVVSAGAIFDYTQYPRLDVKRGGSINGLVVALNRLLQMVIPGANAEGGTYVLGAHGRICDIAELANYRNMVTIVRDRVASLLKKNKTLAEVQAARPTEDYDTRWGRNPAWTAEMFVESVYASLKSGQKPAK
jgi:cyclase